MGTFCFPLLKLFVVCVAFSPGIDHNTLLAENVHYRNLISAKGIHMNIFNNSSWVEYCQRQGKVAARYREKAFALTDLLVCVSVVAIVCLIQASALGNSRTKSLSATCWANLQQLSRASLLFAEDNNGTLVGNSSLYANNSQTDWVYGLLDWSTSSDNTNYNYLVAPAYGALSIYAGKNKSFYKCPADNFLSQPQLSAGWEERVRSYSMNLHMGSGMMDSWNPSLRRYYKNSDIRLLSPSQVFVFIEEHPDSINEGAFIVDTSTASFLDLPASFHDKSAFLSFADGHVDSHRWADSRTVRPVRYSVFSRISDVDNADLEWLQKHYAESDSN